MSAGQASPPVTEVRGARPEDRRAILDLLAETFGAGGLVDDPAFWDWKHGRSPFGPSPCLVAEADGRLVALRAFLPWRFRSGDREVRAVRAVDTATHPEHRGRGLFRRLTLQLADELAAEPTIDRAAFVFNTPNRYSLPGYLDMGWRDAGRLPVWVRPRRPLRLARALVAPGASSDESDSLPDSPAAGVPGLLEEAGLPALLDAVAARARVDGRYHTPRTPEYLRWRYADVPRLAYGARWRLGAGGGSAAVVVRRKLRRGLRELMVAEVLVDGGEGAREAARLLQGLIDETGADVATALAARGTPEAEALARAGFLRLPGAGPRMVVRPLIREGAQDGGGAPNALDPTDRRSFLPALGDLELF